MGSKRNIEKQRVILGNRIRLHHFPSISIVMWDDIKKETTFVMIENVSRTFIQERLRTNIEKIWN